MVYDKPYVFIESDERNSICAISPYDPNNTMNGLYVYENVIGVDEI